MKKALITGITGQDGSYLAKYLIEKGYKVFGTYRRLSTPNFWRLQYLQIYDDVGLIPVDLIDSNSIIEAIKISQPDEIYNLAAQSFVGASFELAVSSGEITGLGVLKFLEAVRLVSPHTKFYQASTSEMFGDNSYNVQSETTPFSPSSPYAASKLFAHNITNIFRNAYGIFAVSGILFNHESPLRGLEFVTRKITNSVAKIKLGLSKNIELGNLEAYRDWGYAPEYVEAMWLMLQQDVPEDFVVATGETHSVREFAEMAFEQAGLKYDDYVLVKDEFKRPLEVNYLKGDYTRISRKLGWHPKTKFSDLINIMLDEDVSRWRNWNCGVHFPWDAWNYPNEKKLLSQKIRYET